MPLLTRFLEEIVTLSPSNWDESEYNGFDDVGSTGIVETMTSKHHGEVQQEEENEEELNEYVVTTVVAIIVLLLILLTIAFEEGKHRILHTADKNMKPIIASLFGEMTVLGFLSLFTFCVTQLGAFETMSIHLFGDGGEEELLEIFEAVHYMLFGVMVFFVMTVLMLVKGAQRTEEDWFLMDLACRSPDYIQELGGDGGVHDGSSTRGKRGYHSPAESKTWRSFLVRSLLSTTKSNFHIDLILFYGIRTEFILERSLVPPFEPATDNGLDNDFNFGRYLSICLGHTFSHVVELEDKTWAFFGLLTILYYGLLMITSSDLTIFAWVWAGTGWAVALYRHYFDYHIWQVAHSMAAPLPRTGTILSSSAAGITEESTPLTTTTTKTATTSSLLPDWTKIELHEDDRPGPNSNARATAAVSSHPTKKRRQRNTRQDTLYWKGRAGPDYYKFVCQIQLVFTSAYISLLLLTVFPHMYHETSSTVQFIVFVIVSLLPFGLLLYTLQESVEYMTIVSNVGVHRMPQTVAQVIREGKVDRVIRSVVLMQKLQLAAANASTKASTTQGRKRDKKSSTSTSSSSLSINQTVELENAGKSFDAMDITGDGHLSVDELKVLLGAVGAPTTDEALNDILSLLDSDQDKDISKDEFLDFYLHHILSSPDDGNNHSKKYGDGDGAAKKELHALGKNIFRQFDRDGSGTITLSEFKAIIESFNVGLSIDELGSLVNEIDEDNTGCIGEHEFVALLENHRHLFQTHHLPPL